MRKKILFFCFFLFCELQIFGSWQRIVTNYSRRTYKASNQNWMIEQHKNGWMYFANNKGLLEYDGTEWNTYPINNAKLRAIYLDNERIYVGGLGQFGFFLPNNKGTLTYKCLSNGINKKKVGNIWNIIKIDQSIFFQSDKSIFCFENNKLRIIKCPHGSVCAAYLYNKLYIVSSTGLEVFNGDRFEQVVSWEPFIHSKIVKLLPYDDKILIVSSKDGLFVYDKHVIYPLNSPINSTIKNKQLLCAAITPQALALGSVQDGAYIYSFQNKTTENFSINNGLQNKTVLSMKFDSDNNLWLGLDNGIDCIHLDSSYFFLYSSKSAIGAGYSSSIYNGYIYFGTNQGVYKANENYNSNDPMNLELVKGTEGQIWSLNKIDNKLFCSGANSLTIIDRNHTENIKGIRGVWSAHQVTNSKIILGTYFGLYLLQKNKGKWSSLYRIQNGDFSSKSLYIDNSTYRTVVWTADKENGLYKLILSNDLTKVTNSKNLNSKSLPKGNNVFIGRIKDKLTICSRNGLFWYNEIKNSLIENIELEKLLDGKKAYSYIKEDSMHNIWYIRDNMLKVALFIDQNNKYKKGKEEYTLRNCLIPDFENINVVDQNHAIISTEDGFSLIQYRMRSKTKTNRLQIRKVYLVKNGEVVFGKSFRWKWESINLKYKDNSIGFKFTLTNYKNLKPSLFSCRLIGSNDENWSHFSTNTYKEFSNLDEGKYTFQVRSMSNDGDKMLIDSFDFIILPPWYRTWWAYTVYILFFLSICIYIVHRFNSKMDKQKQEFNKVSNLKDQKIDLLEQEKLQRELKYKSDELIRSTLNIVRKNEILKEIKKEAVNISQAIKENDAVELKRKTIRLIGQIDNNIAHDDDLKSFQEAFDSVNKDFFKMISERFPELTKRDKLLCVYIKMDLQSKEIAPLMNVSVRGVEINRYRLRKKLGLEERSNLSEFLQKLTL